MILYVDPSALVKRYVGEPGSDVVRAAMAAADVWACCRIGLTEAIRAVGLVANERVLARLRRDWASFAVVEIDEELSARAAELAIQSELGSLDALHLASALMLPRAELTLATWDRKLHAAALDHGIEVLPEALDAPPVEAVPPAERRRFAPAT